MIEFAVIIMGSAAFGASYLAIKLHQRVGELEGRLNNAQVICLSQSTGDPSTQHTHAVHLRI